MNVWLAVMFQLAMLKVPCLNGNRGGPVVVLQAVPLLGLYAGDELLRQLPTCGCADSLV